MADELNAYEGIEVISNTPEPEAQAPDEPAEVVPAVEPEKPEETPLIEPVKPVEEIQATEPEAQPITTEPENEIPESTEPEATQPEVKPAGDEIDTEPVTVDSLQKEITKLKNRHGYLQRQMEKGVVPAETQIVQKEVQPVEPIPVVSDFKTPKPKEDDFEDFDTYNDALLDWKVDAKLAQQEAEKQARENDVIEKEIEVEFRAKLTEGEEKYNDFAEVISDPTVPMNPGMVNLLRETENPADVAYFLAKNKKDCATISQMTSARAAIAIGKIDAKFEAEPVAKLPPEELKKKEKTLPSAPAPIVPIGARETVTKNPDDMTQREYEAYRMEQKKAAGKT